MLFNYIYEEGDVRNKVYNALDCQLDLKGGRVAP